MLLENIGANFSLYLCIMLLTGHMQPALRCQGFVGVHWRSIGGIRHSYLGLVVVTLTYSQYLFSRYITHCDSFFLLSRAWQSISISAGVFFSETLSRITLLVHLVHAPGFCKWCPGCILIFASMHVLFGYFVYFVLCGLFNSISFNSVLFNRHSNRIFIYLSFWTRFIIYFSYNDVII